MADPSLRWLHSRFVVVFFFVMRRLKYTVPTYTDGDVNEESIGGRVTKKSIPKLEILVLFARLGFLKNTL